MTTDDHHPYADLAVMLDALDDAVEEREAAAAKVASLGRVVGDHVATLSMAGSIDRADLVALARRLYWEYPSITVAAIGALLGVAETRVSPVVGPIAAEGRCKTCKRAFEWVKSSRHALAPSTCPACGPVRNASFREIPGWRLTPNG